MAYSDAGKKRKPDSYVVLIRYRLVLPFTLRHTPTMLRQVCHKRRMMMWIVFFSVLLAPAVSRILASDNPNVWV